MIRVHKLILSLSAAWPLAAAAASLDRVVEDVPGRLVLELKVPSFSLIPSGGEGAFKVDCANCEPAMHAGAPDLPVYRFSVLTGGSAPRVTLAILESETRVLAAGIAPYPRYLRPDRPEFRRDDAAFAKAASAEGRVSDARNVRGAPMRGLEIPLALWNEGARTVTLIKRARVQVDFPGLLARPAPGLKGNLRREVKNPVGGAWLYAPARTPRRSALAKTGAPAPVTPGDPLIRFKVRNKNVESFAEDRYYALAYSALPSDAAKAVDSRPLSRLRLLTGINDSLPLAMDSAALSGRLHEIPMEVVDADRDGTFSAGDSLKFFAHGTNIWKRVDNPGTRIRYEYANDPYSFENFYYLDFAGASVGRIDTLPARPRAGTPLTASQYYLRAEKDLETAACDLTDLKDGETGPDWHWKFKGNCGGSPDLEMTASDFASDETDSLPFKAGDTLLVGMYTYPRPASFLIQFQGDTLKSLEDTVSPGHWYQWTGSLPASGAFVPEKARWSGDAPRFEGYTLAYSRTHTLPSGQNAWIFPPETGKPISYRVQGGAGATCARIVDGEATVLMILDDEGVFTDSLPPGADARYLVFRAASPPPANSLELEILPSGDPKGPIRDLATCDGAKIGYPEYLIVTGRALLDQALKLRDYRDSAGRILRLRTAVVTVEDIYRQFSGGRLSPVAIRDFLRYAYTGWGRGDSAAGILKYVVLFGDGHYDYRNIRASGRGTPNIVPPFEYMYESEQVATDDFYAIFEPGPYKLETTALSVAIGRVPVQSSEEAASYLEKVRAYEDPGKAGEWRAHVVLAADDNLQRGNTDDLDKIIRGHTTDSDDLGKVIRKNVSGIVLDKVYLLDYPRNSAFHKPQAAQDLLALMNRGAVTVNYVGHGSSNQWADEVLLQTNDAVARMRNEGRNGMVNAFSCTVGRFESLGSEGMSEQFIKTRNVGAIGTVSATRESYPDPNLRLANEYYARVFPADSAGTLYTVGEALQNAKNSGNTSGTPLNDLKYSLLGEPVLLMRKAPLKVSITEAMDTIRALDCGTLRGRVEGGTGSGKINVKVLAGDIGKVYDNLGASMYPQYADKRGNILFEGTVPYRNGEFSLHYFIPKQISFGDSTARVQAFAWDSLEEREGSAAVLDLRIEGTSAKSECANDDGTGPAIRISGCEKKETAGLDFPERVKLSLPFCLQVDVTDTTGGVITAEGPDEGTTVEIPGTLDPYHPQAGLDELFHKTYQITLDPQVIRPGAHLLKVSAGDGYGNRSTRLMRMDLTADSSLVAIQAYNHPNPMKRNGTTFYFATGMPSAELEYGDNKSAGLPRLAFEVRIFNQAGRLVKVLKQAVSGETRWDGKDEWGTPQANGVYFYKVTATQVRFDYDEKPGFSTVTSRYNTLVLSR